MYKSIYSTYTHLQVTESAVRIDRTSLAAKLPKP